MKKLFPKNKIFSELEAPIQTHLTKQSMKSVVFFLLTFLVWTTKLDISMRLFLSIVFFFGAIFCLIDWYYFITDSVCSLTATYEADNHKEGKKLKKTENVKAYLTCDETRFEVALKKHDDTIARGDTVKLYTLPRYVYQKANGIICISNVLVFYLLSSNQAK